MLRSTVTERQDTIQFDPTRYPILPKTFAYAMQVVVEILMNNLFLFNNTERRRRRTNSLQTWLLLRGIWI